MTQCSNKDLYKVTKQHFERAGLREPDKGDEKMFSFSGLGQCALFLPIDRRLRSTTQR